MLVIQPKMVKFGEVCWGGVSRVSVETSSEGMTKDWDENGPYVVFADSTRRLTSVHVAQEIDGDDVSGPGLGVADELIVEVGSGNDAGRMTISIDVVVESVSYSFSGTRSTRLIQLVAVSSAGDVDPVRVTGGG